MAAHIIEGFSKLSRNEKLIWLEKQVELSDRTLQTINGHLHPDPELQSIYDSFSENTVSNFYMPMGLAPNFLINGNLITVPMVTEESSVVAAASHAAKFWAMHGGFHTKVRDTLKIGQVHFTWSGTVEELQALFNRNRDKLLHTLKPITRRMELRGGGLEDMKILTVIPELQDTYQLFVTFRTANAMGANFINSVLEVLAEEMVRMIKGSDTSGTIEIIMSILSNYTPECCVSCHVEGDSSIFQDIDPNLSGDAFAQKFVKAVEIANHDPYRAVTHNKGIFNGMDAVIIATGNDFRAIEACGHAYASRKGSYGSLSRAEVSGKRFRFSLDVPLAVGTIGGVTGSHPLAAASLEILGHPSAEELMQIVAATGLANNFNAVRSLVTSGIQKGHMKMHLGNILRQLNASPQESAMIKTHFQDRKVSYADVVGFIETIRDQNMQE